MGIQKAGRLPSSCYFFRTPYEKDHYSSLCALAGPWAARVEAATIIKNTPGGGPGFLFGTFGQSFITPDGPAYDNIAFSWLADESTPVASGTLFLLDQPWIGLPEDLSSSTFGFLAQSTAIVNNAYVFDPGVELESGTKYWVYMGGPAQYVSGIVGSGVFNWEFYLQSGSPPYNRVDGMSAGFQLSGNAVPEPSVLMLCAGAGVVGFFRLRRRPRL